MKNFNWKYIGQKIAIGAAGALAIGVAWKTEKRAQENLDAKYDKKKSKKTETTA